MNLANVEREQLIDYSVEYIELLENKQYDLAYKTLLDMKKVFENRIQSEWEEKWLNKRRKNNDKD